MSPVRSANCLVWLIAALQRLPSCYVMIRWSRGGPYPHFLVRTRSRFAHIVSFVPAWADPYAHPTPWWQVGLFRGRMVWGDHAELPYRHKPRTRRANLARAFIAVGLFAALILARLAVLGWELAVFILSHI